MITLEEFKEMQNNIAKASEDDKPYLAPADDELHIVGDPNKTEIIPHTYTVIFAFPKQDKYRNEKIIKETDNYLVCERTYKDVFIPAKRHMSVVNAFTRVEQFLMMISDDGSVRELTEAESLMILQTLEDEIVDAVIDAVAKVLHIDPFEADCIVATSAIKTITQMQVDIQEILNEADYFFGA